jgi:HPr kinase/phosphorylase
MSTGAHSSMPLPRRVTVRRLVEPGVLSVGLRVLSGAAGLDREIAHPRIQKSGLGLVGHFEGISSDRVQVLGQTESSFVAKMPPEAASAAFDALLARGLCAVVLTSGVPHGIARASEARGCPVLVSDAKSSVTINALHAWLDEQLAPRTRVHGVFVDVFGVGILLLGKSGIGKSECALELVQRGHRLVADDVVDCALRPPDSIYGGATELLKNHLEVRGLGVLNIKDLFGVAAVRDRKRVDLVVRLVGREDDESWDRLGLDDEWYEILGQRIPLRRVPVRPGKNTAVTIEVAARNELLRQAGHHSALAFHQRLAAALGVPEPRISAEPLPPPFIAAWDPTEDDEGGAS